MGEVATESVFAVSHVIMNAGIETPIDVCFLRVSFAALINYKILVCAEIFSHFEFAFEFFILEKFLVVHFLLIKK